MITVLVVEDEDLIARELKRTLLRLGYAVPRTANSAGEALRAMSAGPVDLVLMDVNLDGELDGIATATAIRRRWSVPIVYLTSHADDATLARAKDTGPHGYLVKPFNERDLRITIEVALNKHEIEVELARRERWFATTLRSIGDAVIAADDQDRITFMNGVAERLTGWPLAEAQGRRLSDVFRLLTQDGTPMESPTARAMSHGFSIELPANTRLVRRDDGRRDVDDSSSPIVDDRGQLLGGVVVFRDVTERKQAERRLAQAERLAAIGTMAAGMAHELNSPLATVVLNVGLALERLQEVARVLAAGPAGAAGATEVLELTELLADAQRGATRVTDIVRDLRKFSRPDIARRETLDLPDVLDAAIAAVGARATGEVVIERRYGITPYVEANHAQLLQVFGNLLVNAVRSVTGVRARARTITVSTSTDERGRAVVEIRDTGRGIHPDALARIFEPFFQGTGADVDRGAGTGLGLGLCHGVVTSLGGEITADSELDQGSVFRVLLPGAAGALAAARRDEAVDPGAAAPGRRRLLVIDDDADIGRLYRRVLGAEHDLIIESDGRAALARVQAGESFDLVFCDLMMPGFSGIEVYRGIVDAVPALEPRVVFVTGGAIGAEAQAFLATTRNRVVEKPFSPEELRALVRAFTSVHAA